MQLRFSHWFNRETSKILLRLYLLLCVGMVMGSWTFALATHFWTISNAKELHQADHAIDMGSTLVTLCLRSSFAVALLNAGLPRNR
jgi:hypothetical protein